MNSDQLTIATITTNPMMLQGLLFSATVVSSSRWCRFSISDFLRESPTVLDYRPKILGDCPCLPWTLLPGNGSGQKSAWGVPEARKDRGGGHSMLASRPTACTADPHEVMIRSDPHEQWIKEEEGVTLLRISFCSGSLL